jgi:hypothetical protein
MNSSAMEASDDDNQDFLDALEHLQVVEDNEPLVSFLKDASNPFSNQKSRLHSRRVSLVSSAEKTPL